MARKILMSSQNNTYLEHLIALQRSLMNTLKTGRPKTHPSGTPKRIFKGKLNVSKIPTEYCRLAR